MHFHNGNTYTGQFENDKFEGLGKFIQNNGVLVYEGEFKNGKKHGHGKLKDLELQTEFDGQFVGGKVTGQGKMMRFVDNSYIREYEGGWLNG